MSDMLTPFGELCYQARRYLTMTRPELAKLVNTSVKDVSDIETGKKNPTARYVLLVAGILGLDIEEVEISLSESGDQYQLTRIAQPKYGA